MQIFGQKVTKVARKMKRNSKHSHTHQHVHNHDHDHDHANSSSNSSNTMMALEDDSQTLLQQEGVEADVENARKAVERKLIYLSEANHMAAPSRAVRRQALEDHSGNGGKGRGDGKHTKKQRSQEVAGSDKIRIRSGHNALDSPRRNGLSLSDDTEENDMDSLSRRLQDVVLEAEQAERRLSGVYGRQQMSTKPIGAYTCGVCGAKFQIKSLLGAHRRTHDEDFSVRFRTHRPPRSSTTTLTSGHLCKYCDRKFDLERTLHIHQLCHCKKIPPQLRRKLPYTELLHEKKAPLHDQRW